MKPTNEDILEFLKESNAIENIYSNEALEDSLKAWKYASKIDMLDLEDILKIHFLIIKNINPRIAGKLRDCDIFVGGELRRFMSEEFLIKKLKDFIKKFNAYSNKISVIDKKLKHDFTRVNHVEFEKIHPFEDGNGRTGRILYNILRLKVGLPIHIIHEGDEQMEYYKWFK